MSGGFFRGTSADQDTRFSNKQAKLMKSQKFAPELEHLVDMTRVKMDVLRPWIAKRLTELLGFEDEVLINFIYGLLDGKSVNGKEIQISITGFMEKNTGKFMKELWTHLLSAQNNASGVPQQFLDEKEAETRKKMADAERITNEIQRKREREAEEAELIQKKMEGGSDPSRTTATDEKLLAKHRNGRALSYSPDDRKEIAGRNGRNRKARRSRSPHSSDSSPSPNRPRSISRSPKAPRRYSERVHHNRKRSITPHHGRPFRRPPSPSRRRLSYQRRSRSYSSSLSPQPFRSFRRTSPHPRWRRSPSPVWRRSESDIRRRSPSPVRRRSPSPVRRRSPSPVRRRSPSPVRRRSPSPVRRRSPSPVRRRSPSPVRRSSPSPVRRRSPSPVRRRSPSPVRRRSPVWRRSPSPVRSRSPVRQISPSPVRRRSPLRKSLMRQRLPSPVQDRYPLSPLRGSSSSPQRGSSPCPRYNSMSPARRTFPSPLRHRLSSPRICRTPSPGVHLKLNQQSSSTPRNRHLSPRSCRPPVSDSRKWHSPSDGSPPSPDQSICESAIHKQSFLPSRERSPTETRKLALLSSIVKPSSQENRIGLESHGEANSGVVQKEVPSNAIYAEKSPLSSESPPNTNGFFQDGLRSRNKELKVSKESLPQITKESISSHGNLEIRNKISGSTYDNVKDVDLQKGGLLSEQKIKREDGGRHVKPETEAWKLAGKHVRGDCSDSSRKDGNKRKHKGSSSRHEVTSDDDSSESEADEKKDAKRRRKEEKRLKREKRRQRHEEKHRKKEERRGEKHHKSRKDDDSSTEKKKSHDESDGEEEDKKKRRLEIELRKKALESLKAKKGISQ